MIRSEFKLQSDDKTAGKSVTITFFIRSALPPAWSQWWWVVNNVVKVTLGTKISNRIMRGIFKGCFCHSPPLLSQLLPQIQGPLGLLWLPKGLF